MIFCVVIACYLVFGKENTYKKEKKREYVWGDQKKVRMPVIIWKFSYPLSSGHSIQTKNQKVARFWRTFFGHN